MQADTGRQTTAPDLERDDRDWPILKPSAPDACDGCNPTTGHLCTLGHHNGYHRDASGAEWLDD